MNNRIRGKASAVIVLGLLLIFVVLVVLVFRIPIILTYSAQIQFIAALLSSFGLVYQLVLNLKQVELNKKQLLLSERMLNQSETELSKAPRIMLRFQNTSSEGGIQIAKFDLSRSGGEKKVHFFYKNVGKADAKYLDVDLFAICPLEKDVTFEVDGLKELKPSEWLNMWPEDEFPENTDRRYMHHGRIPDEVPADRGEIRSTIIFRTKDFSGHREFLLAFRAKAPNEPEDSKMRLDKLKVIVTSQS